MKYALLILTTLLLWPLYAAHAQCGSDEYESKELETYKEQRHKVFMSYRDLSRANDTIEYQSPYCKIEKITNFSKYVW